jgi:hypothetical protein
MWPAVSACCSPAAACETATTKHKSKSNFEWCGDALQFFWAPGHHGPAPRPIGCCGSFVAHWGRPRLFGGPTTLSTVRPLPLPRLRWAAAHPAAAARIAVVRCNSTHRGRRRGRGRLVLGRRRTPYLIEVVALHCGWKSRNPPSSSFREMVSWLCVAKASDAPLPQRTPAGGST